MVIRQVQDLNGSGAVGKFHRIGDPFDCRCHARLGERVGPQSTWPAQCCSQEVDNTFMGDDSCALRSVCAYPARMIDMKVGHDGVPNRLVGKTLFNRVDYRYGTFFQERNLDNNKMVLHFDNHAVVAASNRMNDTRRHFVQSCGLGPFRKLSFTESHDHTAQSPLGHDAFPDLQVHPLLPEEYRRRTPRRRRY